MNNNNENIVKAKSSRHPIEKVFIVNESCAGKKEFSELFAELLYSEFVRHKPASQSRVMPKSLAK